MNAEQRKKLAACQQVISNQLAIIEQVRDENQESFDNMPEGLQQSENGQNTESAISTLEDVIANLEEVDSQLSEF